MKRFNIVWLPLLIALATGAVIAWYWLGVFLYHCQNDADVSNIPDYAGVLAIDNSDWSAIVVQGRDNSFYLSHSLDGSESKYGCPFIDCDWTDTADNLVIYGHNNLNGTGFSDLVKFRDESYASEHNAITFTDSHGVEHQYALAMVLDFDVRHVSSCNPYSLTVDAGYVERMSRFAIYKDNAISMYEHDKLITLSTCDEHTYGSNGRLVIIGKEV